MHRPGYLSGYEGLVPRAHRGHKLSRGRHARFDGLKGYGRLGAFGKGYAVGPPPPPDAPLAPSRTIRQDNALNRRTKGFYIQDIRCPPGEKMWQRREPCTGPDCDPGEIDSYTECDDDPAYLELPDEDFPSCASRAKAGWPDACTAENCPTCFRTPKQMAMMMMAPGMMPGFPGMGPREYAQELEELEDMPRGASAPSEEYQGGGAPSVPSRAMSRGAPTAESQIAQMVEQHEEEKLMTQYRSPSRTFIIQGGGAGRGRGPGPAGRSGPAESREEGGAPPKRGILGWIRETLFG